MLESIFNYYKVTEQISTSGQPTEVEFNLIAKNGFEVIVNLASPNSPEKLEFEDEIITELGLKYIHIAVEWDNPKQEQLEFFCQIMQALSDKKVWVHCIANYRVSAFMLYYTQKYLNFNKNQATSPLFNEWQPNTTWQNFLSRLNLDKK
jgi:protein tyrosine phosphatase (PTP) superfamily phosphohydrolase (DUF442 family)